METMKKSLTKMLIPAVVFGFFLIGCDSISGEKVYEKRFYQYGYAIKETPSGGFIIAGSSVEKSGKFADMYIMKTDSKGDVKWSKGFGYDGEDIAYDVICTDDGGYVIAGVSETKGPDEITNSTWGTGDARIVKFDSSGNVLWDYWNGSDSGRDTIKSILETTDGGIIATGYTPADNDTKGGVLILKLDSNGNEVFKTVISDETGNRGYLAESIKEVNDGYVIAGDVSVIYGTGDDQRRKNQGFIMKVKVDSVLQSAEIIWEEIYGEAGLDEKLHDVIVAEDGSIIAAGYQADSFYGGRFKRGYIVKTDASGSFKWEKTFTGDGSSSVEWNDFTGITICDDGGFVVTGETKSYGVKSKYRRDVLIVKYNSNGNTAWIKAYDDNGKDNDNYAKDIVSLRNGGFAVVGSTYRGILNGKDIYALKLDSNGDVE